jgi:hypothetical protein
MLIQGYDLNEVRPRWIKLFLGLLFHYPEYYDENISVSK